MSLIRGLALGLFGGGGATQEDEMNLIHTAAVTLTNAEILALPTAYKQIVAAPGAGKVIRVLDGQIEINQAAGAYTNLRASSYLRLRLDGGGGVTNLAQADIVLSDNMLSGLTPVAQVGSGDLAGSLTEQVFLASSVKNKALVLEGWNPNESFESEDFEGGNPANSGLVSVAYLIVDTATGEFVPVS